MIIVKEGVSCETDRKLLWDPKQRPEAHISAGLKGWFLGIYLAYLVAGIAAMGSAIYFLLTPNQRRSSLISSSQLYIVGGTSRRLGPWALKINRVLLLSAMAATLVLGSYVWFESLDVRGQCCGYANSRDHPVFTTTCSPDVIRLGLLPGCSEKLFTFINYYLQNIYSAMFVYVFLGVAALLATLILMHSMHTQLRYEKSLARIYLHNSYPKPKSRDSQRLSSHPISSRHVSVIYNRDSST